MHEIGFVGKIMYKTYLLLGDDQSTTGTIRDGTNHQTIGWVQTKINSLPLNMDKLQVPEKNKV